MKILKRIGLFSFSFFSLIAISSCKKEEKVGAKYTEKEVSVYYENTSQNHKTKLRFYEETKDIPYIGIKNFYNILVKDTALASMGDLKISLDNNLYKVETPKGGVATIDTLNDTFLCDDFVLFNSTNYYDMSVLATRFELDGLPFIKLKSISCDRKPTPFIVNFNDYKINLFGDDTDVYFPFNTVSDLFLNENMLNCSYNQKDIYVFTQFDDSLTDIDNYIDPISNIELSNEYAEYNYMELCFLYDKLLGRPNRSSIERNFNLENGLDYAFSNNDLGKEVKKLLSSTKLSDYFAATELCYYLFADGGHTAFYQYYTYYDLLNDSEKKSFIGSQFQMDMKAAFRSIYNKGYKELIDSEPQAYDVKIIRAAREKMLGLNLDESNTEKKLIGNNSYYKNGDTAIIFVDDFMGEYNNRSLWNDYYSGKRTDIPFGDNLGGCVGAILNGLKKAKEDNIKNVVIDLSSNPGGSVDELIYLISALTNKKQVSYYNCLSCQKITADFDVDINFDKKFDEKDNISLVEDLNLAVLSSNTGFSCGGISPIYLHEANIFTMGDNSGGGSCAIYAIYDAYGLLHYASSPHVLYTLNGACIDAVRNTSCDLFIPTPIVDGVKNYDEFFNVEKLTQYINEHYQNA